MVSKNDNLNELFCKFTKNDIHFIWQWLKVFAILNHHNLKLRANKYLASKGLAYDNWMTSITDGMKGDIFVLSALCMLFDRHAIVHLRNGLVWSTLDRVSDDHYTDLKKCDLHLCYVGCGLFAELSERAIPLELASDSTETVQSFIVGELTTTKKQSLMMVVTAGLGVGTLKEEHQSSVRSIEHTKPAPHHQKEKLPNKVLQVPHPK